MAHPDSRVTIHMAMSLDGFIARKDGSVDWMETSDEFAEGAIWYYQPSKRAAEA